MSGLLLRIDSAEQIRAAAAELRAVVDDREITANDVLDVFERWSEALGSVDPTDVAGLPFLRLWLRRNTLEPIITRELGDGSLDGEWSGDGRSRLKAYPVGIVGHWPAGNIDIQPMLSMSCALLGGNACLVRVPGALLKQVEFLIAALAESDREGVVTRRIRLLAFEHERRDLQCAMAEVCDGAMIWGGEEAVSQVRLLPFSYWARLAVFGPRISVAAIDAASWSGEDARTALSRRIARDVWQFDQQACSSPQVLFVETNGHSADDFIHALRKAFEEENRAHPRESIDASLTSVICRGRAAWLMQNVANRAVFPATPDWTILIGHGTATPEPTQGKTLTVLQVSDLHEAIASLDANVQTLGLAISDGNREAELAAIAAGRGIDRIVQVGRMHVFGPPWDGQDLIRSMVRMVRHVRATA